MTGRNYVNPNDRGRFGFSESGEFRAPFKGAHVVSALVIAAAVIVIALTVVTALAMYRKILPTVANGEMLLSLIAIFVIAVIILVCILVAVLSIRALNYGFKCSYIANDEKMVLTVGGDTRTIYYKDVQTVHFQPRSSFGKVNGYDVTVKINGANEHYSITFDGFLSEKNTPFYILRERAEMLRNAESAERARLAGMTALGNNNRPILAEDVAKAQQRKKDVYDRVADLLGKDAEMPGVSLAKDDRNTARAVRAYRAEQEARAANVPVIPEGLEVDYDVAKIREKVSPTVGGYAADMPALGKDGKVVAPPQMYMGEDGRETNINDMIGSGTFRVPRSKRAAVPLWIVVVILLALAVITALQAITLIAINMLGAIAYFGIALVPLAIALTIIKYIRQGKEYSYKANGREFVVTAKNKPEEHIYYNEVAGVTYSKRKFLWFDDGYNVEITTSYGIIRYQYVFPRFRHTIKTEDLPFELIRKNAERQNKGG